MEHRLPLLCGGMCALLSRRAGCSRRRTSCPRSLDYEAPAPRDETAPEHRGSYLKPEVSVRYIQKGTPPGPLRPRVPPRAQPHRNRRNLGAISEIAGAGRTLWLQSGTAATKAQDSSTRRVLHERRLSAQQVNVWTSLLAGIRVRQQCDCTHGCQWCAVSASGPPKQKARDLISSIDNSGADQIHPGWRGIP